MKRVWCILFAVFFLIPLASANDYSFSVLPSDKEMALCNLEYREFSILLENDGNLSDAYNVRVEGPKGFFVSVPEGDVELAPGDDVRVFMQVDVLGAKPGDYVISIVTTPKEAPFEGVTKIGLSVRDCFDFTADIVSPESSFCSGANESLGIVLKNTGIAPDLLTLDVKNSPSWVSLSSTEVALNSTDSETVNVIANAPFGVTGSYKYDLKVEGFDQVATIPLLLNIMECKSSLIEANVTEFKVCRDVVSTIPFSVKNLEEGPSDVALSLDGAPDWVSLENASVTLPYNGSVSTFLEVSPSNDSKDSKFVVNAFDQDIPSKSSAQFSVSLKSNKECAQGSNESGSNIVTSLFSWIFSPRGLGSTPLSGNESVNESKENISDEGSLEAELENVTGLDIKFENDTGNRTEDFLAGLAVKDEGEGFSLTDFLIKYRWVLVLVFVLIIFLIVLFSLDSFSKIFEFFSSEKLPEDEELLKELEDEEDVEMEVLAKPVEQLQPSRVGRVFFLILALALIVFLAFRFFPVLGGLNFFYVYRSYLIVGLIVGIVLVLILHFREGIIKFFEEEDKKEKPKDEKND